MDMYLTARIAELEAAALHHEQQAFAARVAIQELRAVQEKLKEPADAPPTDPAPAAEPPHA